MSKPQQRTQRPATGDGGRGRAADKPTEIPAKGWKDVAYRVKEEVKEDNVGLLAAGVAFFALLALFPALTAAVSIYGLVADPQTVQSQIQSLTETLPADAASLIGGQLEAVASSAGGALTFGFVTSLLAALWTASSGMQGLIKGVNAAYDEPDGRSFVKRRGLALLLTIGGIIFFGVAIAVIAVLPALLDGLGLGRVGQVLILVLRWPLLAALIAVALAVVYRYAPDRDEPRWAWVSAGAALATVLWVVGSIAFSIYVNNFGSYNETYGAIGAVIILLLWLFLSSFVVLVGAEVNAETEHQTAQDTTKGPREPLGQRDAYAADTIGEAKD